MATKSKKAKTSKTAANTAPVNGTDAPNTAAEGQAPAGAVLSIGDLKNLSTVIDVASTRGAFRANEMAMVGMVYNKLQQFLAKVAPASADGEQKAGEEKTVGKDASMASVPAGK